jgi:dihydroorotate dehydrogenase (fumarate)
MTTLKTSYLGLQLPHPFMPGASPLVDNLDRIRQLEDAGAAAIVMHSLFEEQILRDLAIHELHVFPHENASAEARTYLPRQEEYGLEPDQYLQQIRKIKEAVDIPVIGSLNGTHLGGWIEYSSLIQQAGADALELNLHFLPTDPTESGLDVERRILEIVRTVRESVSIPLAVKMSPYLSSPAHFAKQIDALGVNGMVLFNRPYQADIDIENLEVVPRLGLSTSGELSQRLRWLAILHGHVNASLAVTGGVHVVEDAVKALMAGASAVQVVSALLCYGPTYIGTLVHGLRSWLDEHEYESLEQMIGSMSLRKCPNPEAFERGQYLRTLQMWKS